MRLAGLCVFGNQLRSVLSSYKTIILFCYLLSSKLISSKLMFTAGEPIKYNVIVPIVHFIFST